VNRVCVYSGSSPGKREAYAAAAGDLGRLLARRSVTVVYGGADVGLMGALADAALAEGGRVIGVITKALADAEIAHGGLTELRVVASMHERKAVMEALSDAFVALPGGVGTLEELAEMLAWAQLGLHRKPCGLLNVNGYFDRLIDFLDHAVAERFIRPVHREQLIVAGTPEELLSSFAAYRPRFTPKWMDRAPVGGE